MVVTLASTRSVTTSIASEENLRTCEGKKRELVAGARIFILNDGKVAGISPAKGECHKKAQKARKDLGNTNVLFVPFCG